MKPSTKISVRASLNMLGTIVGAGTFALPAAFSQMGILAGSVVYWIAALAVLATHLFYVEVIFQNKTSESHRLPAQAGALFGPWARRLAYVLHPAQVIGACLAYLILSGDFLSVLAKAVGLPSTTLIYQVLFWAGGSLVVFCGLKFVAKIESWTVWMMIVLVIVSVALFWQNIDGSLFMVSHWNAVPELAGVFLFALFGWEVIPEIALVTGKDHERTRLTVVIGSLAGALLMWLFGVCAAAAVGGSLTSNVTDLARGMSAGWFWLLPAVGFFVVATPFVNLSQDLKAMLHLDAKLPEGVAWTIAMGAPLALLFLTSRNFLSTVGFVGGVVAACNGILICAMGARVLKRSKRSSWRPIAYLCILIFAAVLIV